ncbi:hypothetical protein IAT38_004464 [Cryptococcus sp. DSM 104549]
MSSAQSSQGSQRALADLIDACKSENEKAVKRVVSENGSTMYGSKDLETIWKSTEVMFEPGTSCVQFDDETLIGTNHSFLVTPGGAVEALTGPLAEAHASEEKPDALTMRILHSLQGTPTQLFQPDFMGVVGAVKRAETNSATEASKDAYEAALGALQSAREAQQAGGPGASFKLDLSKMPFSMQPRSEQSWPRGTDKDIDTLARWAFINVTRNHAERGPLSRVEHLKLDHNNVDMGDLFSNTQLDGLRRRMDKVADALYDVRDTENSWNPDAVIGWELQVPKCDCGEDCTHDERNHLMAERFAQTLILNSNAQLYRFDTTLSVAAKGRALTRQEMRDLMPEDLAEEYDDYSAIELVPASRNAEMTRPSAFISAEDTEALAFWKEFSLRREAGMRADPKVKDVPAEGYDSLMDHVRLIRQGKAEEAWESRYGKGSTMEAISEAHENRGLRGFEYWLHYTGKAAFEQLTEQRMDNTLPPEAYEEWKEMQAENKTGGMSLNEYALRRKAAEQSAP